MSDFVSAFRKSFDWNYALISLTEAWKKFLDNESIVGAALIPHDILIAKLAKTIANRFWMDTLIFMYSYLKRRKQNVEKNPLKPC